MASTRAFRTPIFIAIVFNVSSIVGWIQDYYRTPNKDMLSSPFASYMFYTLAVSVAYFVIVWVRGIGSISHKERIVYYMLIFVLLVTGSVYFETIKSNAHNLKDSKNPIIAPIVKPEIMQPVKEEKATKHKKPKPDNTQATVKQRQLTKGILSYILREMPDTNHRIEFNIPTNDKESVNYCNLIEKALRVKGFKGFNRNPWPGDLKFDTVEVTGGYSPGFYEIWIYSTANVAQ